MFFKLILLFITVPLVEVFLLTLLSSEYGIGWLWTVALVMFTGIVGAWLARRQGAQAYYRIRTDLATGRLPTDSVLDGLLIFIAGALLMTPGILTDAVGFSLLIPVSRNFVKTWLVIWFKRHFNLQHFQAAPHNNPARGDVIDSYVIRSGKTSNTDNS